MAKRKVAKRGINKSQAVRNELKKGITSPKEVVANLAKRDISVSAAFVSNVKSGMKKQRTTKEARTAFKDTAGRSSQYTGESKPLLAAVDLVVLVGVKEAHALIDTAEQLVEHVEARLK
ncbi:MAG: hypothetical protein KDA87_03060 [Planctomycetales bacterium]|nr:hypothetical protein [Planctomycetales bacterium]